MVKKKQIQDLQEKSQVSGKAQDCKTVLYHKIQFSPMHFTILRRTFGNLNVSVLEQIYQQAQITFQDCFNI